MHFKTHSAFNAEYGDVGWFKCQAARIREVDSYSFVMNHGTWGAVTGPDDPAKSLPGSQGCPNGTLQCLRFLKSKDALHWEYMYTSQPNISLGYTAKGKVSTSRWDDAYMTEDTTRGGYVAFGTGTPSAGPGAAMLRSADGLTWLPAGPAVARFRDVNVESTGFEVGGVEKMSDGQYYMLIGSSGPRDAHDSYSMWTLRTNGSDIAGPYYPDAKAYRVSGQSEHHTPRSFLELADWVRDYDKPWGGNALVSQYISMPKTSDTPVGGISGGHVFMLPFRQPLIDSEGHLRLSYWRGNEALKGTPLPLNQQHLSGSSAGGLVKFNWFAGSETWDHSVGAILTGVLHAPSSTGAEIGFAMKMGASASIVTSIMMEVKPNHDESRSTRVSDHTECVDLAGTWDSVGHPVVVTQTGCVVQANNSDGNFTWWDHPTGTTVNCATSNSVTINFHPSGPRPGPVLTGLIYGTANNLTIAWFHDGSNARSFWFRRKIGQPLGSPTAEKIRDTTGPFECGARSSLTCLPATTTGVAPGGVVPFLMFARHGIFELYVGSPLLLVQTSTYGVYPVARAAMGLGVKNGSGYIADAKAWQMSLVGRP
eukprot:SAG31_NODE_4671_length_3046_cov_1.695623_2_plen_593_part_00